MNKTLLVLRYEIIRTVTRRSFLFTILGIPLIAVLIFVVFAFLKGSKADVADRGKSSLKKSDQLKVEGYVDHSGLIKAIHKDVPEGILVAYPDEASARRALRAGEITAYYIIPADYVESGELIYMNPNYSWASSKGQSWVMRRTLTANLLDNDPERIQRFWHPMDVETKSLAPPKAGAEEKKPMPFTLPYATTMILTVVILMSSGLMLHSIAGEKKSQVMEVLMVSVTPREMLTGKVIGLGILGLLQTMVWIVTAYVLLRLGGGMLNLPASAELPPLILLWGIVFFLLGYAVYASLMAGLGALTPNIKEASQATIVVIWPLVLSLSLSGALIRHPHGALATGLSLFPLTSPAVMIIRLVAGGVPFWQPILAVALLLFTAFFIVRAVAAMFHAQLLLSGQSFSVKRFFSALLGRAHDLPKLEIRTK